MARWPPMVTRVRVTLKSKHPHWCKPHLRHARGDQCNANTEEKIQSAQQKQHQPSPKEDTPSKELSKSSSKEEQPTDEALCKKAQQRAWQLDTNFDAWQCKKIAKGIAG